MRPEVRLGSLYRKHGLFHIRYFENGPLEPGGPSFTKDSHAAIVYDFYDINHIKRTFTQADGQ